jgi:hypothetical protein
MTELKAKRDKEEEELRNWQNKFKRQVRSLLFGGGCYSWLSD